MWSANSSMKADESRTGGRSGWVEVDPEPLMVADSVERLFGLSQVVGYDRVDLEAPPQTLLVEDVDDRVPPLGEVL